MEYFSEVVSIAVCAEVAEVERFDTKVSTSVLLIESVIILTYDVYSMWIIKLL